MKRQAYGVGGLIDVQEVLKVGSGVPTTSTRASLGTLYFDKTGSALYFLSSISGSTYTWTKYGNFTGDISVTGDVELAAANTISMKTGAVTDYAGTGALTAGVLEILNTNIKATDLVFVQRISEEASTAIGVFSYAIVADTSLTITSLKTADASTETDDVSTVAYFIIKTS